MTFPARFASVAGCTLAGVVLLGSCAGHKVVSDDTYTLLKRVTPDRAEKYSALSERQQDPAIRRSQEEVEDCLQCDAEYVVPETEGVLSAFQQASRESSGQSSYAKLQSTGRTDYLSELLKALKEKGSLNLAAILDGGTSVDVLSTDVYSITFQKLLGMGGSAALGKWSLQTTVGTVIVDQNNGQTGDLAASLGIKIPLGDAGALGIGLGAVKDGSGWEEGLYLSINLAGSRPATRPNP